MRFDPLIRRWHSVRANNQASHLTSSVPVSLDARVGAAQERLPEPSSAEEGGLLFGDFLLATQEKVTRAPQAHETPLLTRRQERSTKHRD